MKFNKEKLKPLGDGHEKAVYDDPNNPDLALGIFHEYIDASVLLIKARFYLTKITHLLSSENVPDVHLVSSDPNTIVVDKIQGRDLYEEKDWEKHDADIDALKIKLDGLGINQIDDFRGNFKYDKDENIVYVDSFNPWKSGSPMNPNYDKEKLEKALQKLKEEKRELGLNYLKRLEVLREEEIKNLQKAGEKDKK